MISVQDSLPGMCQMRDAHPVNQPDSVVFADRPAYAAAIAVLLPHRAFPVLTVIPDGAEIAPFQTLPAAIACRIIDFGDIFTLPHHLAKLHLHLKPVCHAIPVAVAQRSNERRIECPQTVGLPLVIELPDESLRLVSTQAVKVSEVRDIPEDGR